jgi:type III secretion protein U
MSEEKTEQPTRRKLKKAREKGQVFKSADVTQTAIFIGLLLAGWGTASLFFPKLKAFVDNWPVVIGQLSKQLDSSRSQTASVVLEQGMYLLVYGVAPLLAILIFVGLLAAGLQVQGVFSIDPLIPKGERFNPGANLKRVVSSRNLIDLCKTVAKVVCLLVAVYIATRGFVGNWVAVIGSNATAMQIASVLGRCFVLVAFTCLALYIFFAAADYGHQYYEYIKEQKMSKDELRREFKEVEGDPYLQGYRRALMRSIATEGVDAQLLKAKLVVTNPTHFAVALAYEPGTNTLPRVVAKGSGQAAKAIRERANLAGIPIVENKPLARMLYAQVPVGAYIQSTHFSDVARVMAGVSRLRAVRDHEVVRAV